MNSIEEALVLKKELDNLRPLTKEQEDTIMQKFRLDWNYHSNNLEGNSLTYGETKALLLYGITAQGKPLKDHFEITGHDEAIKWIEDLVKGDYPLTENFIRELHTLLLKSPYEVKAITPDGQQTSRRIAVGQYKTTPNHVQTSTGEIFRFATPEETPSKMHDLINWFRSEIEKPDVNTLILAAEFHYRFIRIHPFDDGNGRTARILMNFILMKFGYPPVIIKTEDKENYFSALRQADAGMIIFFIEYIAQNLVKSLNIMLSGARGESIEEEDDVLKELALLKAQLKNEKQTKSPLLTYNTIENFRSASLPILDEVIKEIDDLFADSRLSIYVNGKAFKDNLLNNNFLNIHTILNISTGLTSEKKLNIFGKDLYKDEIKEITWITEKWGLKGATKKGDLNVEIKLVLGDIHPALKVKVNTQPNIIEYPYHYEKSIDMEVLEHFKKLLLKSIMKEIKLSI